MGVCAGAGACGGSSGAGGGGSGAGAGMGASSSLTLPCEEPSVPQRIRRSPFRLTSPPASSTPVRPTAVELRRQQESGAEASSFDSPSQVLGSPEKPAARFSFAAAGSPVRSAAAAPAAGSSTCPPAPDSADDLLAAVHTGTDVIVSEDVALSVAGLGDGDGGGGGGSGKGTSRKEKSLGCLCLRFLAIYLLGRSSVSLDEAAAVLAGPELCPPAAMRTKIRRLYDIANVLCTLRLLEKVSAPSSGKRFVFVWRGPVNMWQCLPVAPASRALDGPVDGPVKLPVAAAPSRSRAIVAGAPAAAPAVATVVGTGAGVAETAVAVAAAAPTKKRGRPAAAVAAPASNPVVVSVGKPSAGAAKVQKRA